jgi:hypothetical protein
VSKKPLIKPYRWSESEDTLLRRYYRLRGSREVQRMLANRGIHRTIAGIQRRAKRLDCRLEDLRPDLVPLVEVHGDEHASSYGSHANRRIVLAATRDGVIVRSAIYPHIRYAPQKWVDAYIAKLTEDVDIEREAVRSWIPTQELARLFGVGLNSLYTITSNSTGKRYAIHAYLARIPNVHVNRNIDGVYYRGRYWRPDEARAEAGRYQARRIHRRMRIQRSRVQAAA